MSSGAVFLVDGDGNLTRMSAGAPPTEDRMQSLVARFPELISDGNGDLLLIKREQPVPDSMGGSGRWSLDHLFVTQAGVPVLAELKRASDTRLRREVVGQLLDYAANGVAYWQPGQIADAFIATCEAAGARADDVLSAFLRDQPADAFWAQVDANLEAGRIRLVFVADVIPPELARIVEFLNEQMRADVRAVELNWFEGEGGVTTLVPRVTGETQRAVAQKTNRNSGPVPSVDEWIDQNMPAHGADAVAGARAFVKWIEELGASPVVSSAKGAIRAVFAGRSGASVYPLCLWEFGAMVEVPFRTLRAPALADPIERQQRWDAINAVTPLSTKNLSGGPGFKVALLADPATLAALTPPVRALIEWAVRGA